jgi:hypothetical protein
MIDERFAILGALLGFIGFFSYLRDTISGKATPNRVSWFLWGATPLIAFGAELQHGVGWPALMTFMVGFRPMTIFLASFLNREARWALTRLDTICGVLAIIGIILWRTTGSGSMAILFSILADGLASVPTIVKAYRAPESESWLFFLFAGLGGAITLLTIDTWDIAHYGFPVDIMAIGFLLAVLIAFRIPLPGRHFRDNGIAESHPTR